MAIQYISTRGLDESLGFEQAVLGGLARDGGLLVPKTLPDFSDRLDELSGLSYQQLAFEIFWPFVEGEIPAEDLRQLIERSYASFTDAEVTPLVLGEQFAVLELFHGPTLAFKDVALQFLGNLFEYFLQRSGKSITIVGATSGDTGSAAIYGVRGKQQIRIFMLHPKGRVSPIQERQMTSVLDDNVVNIAFDGVFDDGQRIVKELFNDHQFRDEQHLAAVNSINWARILAQTLYYFYAAFRLWQHKPGAPLNFSVPTGNFGDVYAGYLAAKMGLPIHKLVVATNDNDILSRTLNTGCYQVREALPTHSPSMDIQVSSNFERLLFDLCDRDGSAVQKLMTDLAQTGQFSLSAEQLEAASQLFVAGRADNAQTLQTIAQQQQQQGWLLDPHTAVGVAVAQQLALDYPICLATAHPAKFGDAVEQATGQAPELPPSIADIWQRQTRCVESPATKEAIAALIRA